MVHKYFQDKEIMAQKAVKSQEMQLKRIASCMAKEIKQFWTNVEKVSTVNSNRESLPNQLKLMCSSVIGASLSVRES